MEEETEWLPVVELEVVEAQNGCFVQVLDPMENMAFHSDEGREMARTEWRAWTPRVGASR
jgi:hypothetical protein